MKQWKNIVAFILILAMPVSLWANVTMASHCQTSNSSSHTMHSQIDNGMHMHMNHEVTTEVVDNSSGCDCGCNDLMDCSVSGCHGTALLNGSELKYNPYTQSIVQLAGPLAPSPDPHLLFRPPILLSLA
tara:strand:+ start:72 stop:458 length:387 start_codon:yes stop_codon:yes gene_type:complete